MKKGYQPCQYYGKTNHPQFKCWKRPDTRCNKCNQFRHEVAIFKRLDARCNKYNQFRHEVVIFKTKLQKQEANAQVVDQDDKIKCWKCEVTSWCNRFSVGDGKFLCILVYLSRLLGYPKQHLNVVHPGLKLLADLG